jgi:hypothetical protein
MKYLISILLTLAILALPVSSLVVSPTASAQGYSGFPTITIVSVVRNESVTITANNLPPNDSFKVLMNYMGTRGQNGWQVGTFNSGGGGNQTYSYNIPSQLVGEYQIAIRIQSTTGSGFFAYNWFYNDTSGQTGGPSQPPPASGYSGYPTISIVSVVRDESVTIKTNNMPPNDTFQVLMNYMGTRGQNGWNVGSINSGEGGSATYTFNIPSQLVGQYQIAIRIQSPTSGYFAFNWFYNNTSGGATGGGGIPGYSGFPSIGIASVVKDTSVTVKLTNLPPNDEFRVQMGAFGTKGVNGIKVGSVDTTLGATQTLTFNIPEQLYGRAQIAIRIESKTGSGYFAYNWFYNSTSG